MQHKLVVAFAILAILTACAQRQAGSTATAPAAESDVLSPLAIDTLAPTTPDDEEVLVAQPTKADELFDDFIFNYASDPTLQRQRTVFPLPYYKGDTPVHIERTDWEHDYLFAQQPCYTLLFDREDDMEMVGDTTLHSVQVEFFPLGSSQVKKFYFEKKGGAWMLEAINLRQAERDSVTTQTGTKRKESFLEFYARFATDSVYQLEHIRNPLSYVTLDPDDEFSILETTIDAEQWPAFSPALPTEGLTNINYGQRNDDLSREKILKVNGIGNGFSNVFYFKRRHGEWELYKFEDTGQ